jgi:hypothetical protein
MTFFVSIRTVSVNGISSRSPSTIEAYLYQGVAASDLWHRPCTFETRTHTCLIARILTGGRSSVEHSFDRPGGAAKPEGSKTLPRATSAVALWSRMPGKGSSRRSKGRSCSRIRPLSVSSELAPPRRSSGAPFSIGCLPLESLRARHWPKRLPGCRQRTRRRSAERTDLLASSK